VTAGTDAAADQPMRSALKRVAGILKAESIPFALSGGYASWARGGPEPVHDVDFFLVQDDVPHALHVLGEAGLRVVHPPEDWLEKVYDGDVLVDLIFRPAERSVTREELDRATEVNVDSVLMPVVSATDLLVSKLLVLGEHGCDMAAIFPHARALREQIDWTALRGAVADSPFARACLRLCEELGIIEPEPVHGEVHGVSA
jgi:hypothetical protein